MIYSPLQISSEMFPVSANVMRLNWLMAFLEGICFLPTSGILQEAAWINQQAELAVPEWKRGQKSYELVMQPCFEAASNSLSLRVMH